MSIETKKEIILQKNQVFEQEFQVKLNESCSAGNGIVRLSDDEKEMMINNFDTLEFTPSFFIPGSGSGSRMFKFLFEWLENRTSSKEINEFFDNIDSFPFYNELVEEGLTSDLNDVEIVEFILNKFAVLPKGLIPFHKYDSSVSTAFQDQVLQAQSLFGESVKIHFTVQKEFEQAIKSNIKTRVLDDSNISFSNQKEETNAFCFNNDGDVVKHGDKFLKRPAGHGALLNNLNEIDGDIVLIKNIDNIQHNSKVKATEKTWKIAMSLLLKFKAELLALSKDFSKESLIELNTRYQFISSDLLSNMDVHSLKVFLNRPTRVAGMVKNEGEPGGGPFWVSEQGGVTNQIIEKAQIKDLASEQEIVQASSHFNPVFIVVSKTDAFGNNLNILDFRDDSKFFVVKKSHQGKEILYRELPGLWNGGMSDWNTIFLEIPSAIFSPVKSVLDLNKSAHKA